MKKNSDSATEPTNADLRDNLWEAYFKRSGRADPSDGLARHVGAIEQLHVLREFNKTAAQEDRLFGVTMALELWSLMASEIGEWIIQELKQSGVSLPQPDDPADLERAKLKYILSLQEASRGPPQHRQSLDPATFFMPRWQALKLIEALEALDEGEVRPLFQPGATGRHSSPKRWDEMRYRALEHVAFLVGQGVGKGDAQKRVGENMKAPWNTLKDWEKRASAQTAVQRRLDLAKRAGKLAVILSDDPDYAKAGKMDAHEAAKLDDLANVEDLAAFGARYFAAYGHRHNP